MKWGKLKAPKSFYLESFGGPSPGIQNEGSLVQNWTDEFCGTILKQSIIITHVYSSHTTLWQLQNLVMGCAVSHQSSTHVDGSDLFPPSDSDVYLLFVQTCHTNSIYWDL